MIYLNYFCWKSKMLFVTFLAFFSGSVLALSVTYIIVQMCIHRCTRYDELV